jgi:hypothetical protein
LLLIYLGQTRFNFAWGLVKSGNKDLQMEGVTLLQGTSTWPSHGPPCRREKAVIAEPAPFCADISVANALPRATPIHHRLAAEIYAAEPLRRRECLYYLALGYFKLGNWDHARRFNSPCRPVSIWRAAAVLPVVRWSTTGCRRARGLLQLDLQPAQRPRPLTPLLPAYPSYLNQTCC